MFCYFIMLYFATLLSPLGVWHSPLFEQTLIHFTQGTFARSLVLEKVFKISSLYFCLITIVSLWKTARPFIWTKLNFHHPRILCAKWSWNWLSGYGKEDENVKCLRQLQRRRQRRRRAYFDQKCSLAPLAQVSYTYT